MNKQVIKIIKKGTVEATDPADRAGQKQEPAKSIAGTIEDWIDERRKNQMNERQFSALQIAGW